MSKPLANQIPTEEELQAMLTMWGERHPLHTHEYLDNIFDQNMNDANRVRRFMEVLYTFCEVFHDCLIALAANTHDEAIRRAIADNLFEEYGAGEEERGHLELMRRLLYSLGYDQADISNVSVNPGAEHFMEEILRYCANEDPLKAVGLDAEKLAS